MKIDTEYILHFSDLLVETHFFKCHQMHLFIQTHYLQRILLTQKKAIVCHFCFGTLCWVTTCSDTGCFYWFLPITLSAIVFMRVIR